MELLVGDVFRNAARACPDRLAAAANEHELTFGELDRQSNGLARALGTLGVGLGDRVLTWTDSTIDLVPVFAAVAKAGAVFAPANGRLALDEVAPAAAMARPALLVVDRPRAGQASLLGARLGVPWAIADTVTAGPEGPSLRELAARECADPLEPVAGLGERDPHVVFFTSGSTGRPKGVVLSHRSSVLRSHPGAQLEPRGALLCPFPLFHMAAWTLSMQQWHARDAIVYTAPDGAEICAAVERHHACRVYLIPAVARRVLEHLARPACPGHDLTGVRFADTGTSATPPELLAEMGKAMPNAVLRVFYGSTEAANVAALDQVDFERKPGSCGTPSPLTDVRRSADGELQVRNALMFDGYFDDVDATAAAFTPDGWFRTGDRVEIDAEGYLTITGRLHDVIRSGGESIAPVEVEQVLASHPRIADVAVVGVPDPTWGEVVCAVVVPVGAEAPTLDDLRKHCSSLASHKHPRRLLVVGAIPRTPATMQVQRSLLVELAQSSAAS